MPYLCYYAGRGPSGSAGPSGHTPSTASTGTSGGEGVIEITEYSASNHAEKLNFTFVRMILQEAEMDYLNERRRKAADKLLWLLDLMDTNPYVAPETADSMVPGLQPDEVDTQQLEIIQSRIKVFLTQLSQGLDYYGHFPDFVPLTSVKVYENAIDSMLPMATDIESAYEVYYDDQQDDVRKRQALGQAVSSLEFKVTGLNSQADQLNMEVRLARKQVKDLLEEELELEMKVNEAREAFKSAVETEAACDFGDVIMAATAVAAVASGVGAIAGGITALGKAGDMIEKSESLKQWKETGKYIVKQAKVIGGGTDKIKAGYADVKDILERERDGAKLIAAERDFEASVKKFEHLPEAREYRRLTRQYLGVIKLRNGKILEIDSKITRLLEIQTEQDSLEVEIDLAKGRMIEVFNPRLAEHMIFFERALTRVKSDLIRAIVMGHKALQYWSLTDNLLPRDLSARSIDHIKAYHLSFKGRRLQLIEERNQAPLTMAPPEMVFNREDHIEEFRVFDKTGRFSFTLSEDHPAFRFYSQALVNEARVTMRVEEAIPGWSWVFMKHQGNPVFVDQFGKSHQFSHRHRETNKALQPGVLATSLKLGGSDNYAFLSPLATWSFMMEFMDIDGQVQTGEAEILSRANIKEIKIGFVGVAFSRYS